MFRFPIAFSLAATLAIGLGGCAGGGDLLLPDAGLPAQIAVVRGGSQAAPVGATLPESVVVRVTDSQGRPVVGQAVAFVLGSPGGEVAPDTIATDAGGQASAQWVLGTTAGAQSMSVRVVGQASLATSVSAIAGAGGAAGLTIVSGDNQTAPAGSALIDSLVVSVADASGNPVSGVDVAWTTGGGGSVSSALLPTGADGRAAVRRALGPAAGAQTTTAAVAAVAGSPVIFQAIATVGAAGSLTIATAPSSSAQSGAPFAQQPVLQLRDANGNPVAQAGVAVTASIASGPAGASLVGSATAATNASGVAVFTGLGVSGPGGSYTLDFGGTGLAGVSSGTITLSAGNATALALTTQPSITATSGSALARQPVVQLLDASGNPSAHAGVTVQAAVGSGSGTLGGTTSLTTDATGRAAFTNLAITGPSGSCTLVFFSGGLTAVTSGGITLAGAAISGSRSTVSVAPASIVASSGASTATVTVTVRDAAGQPVSGATVTLAATGTGNAITPASALSGANGTAAFGISSTVAQTKTVTATAGGVTVAQTGQLVVTAGAASAAQSDASVPGGKRNQLTIFSVQLRDAFDNDLSTSGGSVTASVSGKNAGKLVLIFDHGDGTYTGAYTPTSTGTDMVDIRLNGTPIGGSPYQSKVK